jgi:hypothetical protein
MPPRLHFLLIRYAHYACLVLGVALTAWFWKDSALPAVFLFLLPGLLLFFFLPQFFRVVLPALCPGCNSPVGVSEKECEHGFVEYIYRCRACTHQHHTGVFAKRDTA